ncbi:MAG: PH domain-containing protein [Rhodomicrobium sp.]
MSYIDNHLLPSEKVIYRARLHWIEYIVNLYWSTILGIIIVGPLALIPYLYRNWWMLVIAFAMFPIIGILTALNKIRTSEFAVTDHRVMVKVGVIRRHSLEIMLPQVEGIGVDQGILGRILSYGTITVSGTGATHEHFIRIRNPLEFRRRVHVLVRGELPSCPPSSP